MTGKRQAQTGKKTGMPVTMPVNLPPMTVKDAAAETGMSERTLRRKIRGGELETVLIGGKVHVQADSLFRLAAMTGTSTGTDRQKTDNAGDNAGADAGGADELLGDIIRRQDGEIAFLRAELTAIRAAMESVTRMLPAPGGGASDNPQGKGTPWLVAVAAILAAILIIGGGWWGLNCRIR